MAKIQITPGTVQAITQAIDLFGNSRVEPGFFSERLLRSMI